MASSVSSVISILEGEEGESLQFFTSCVLQIDIS